MDKKVILDNGKYKFYLDENRILVCDRYDHVRWRIFVGDKAIYSLFVEVEELQEENKRLKEENERLKRELEAERGY